MKRKIVLTALTALIILAIMGMNYRGNKADEDDLDKPVPVDVAVATRGDMMTELAYSGTVKDGFSAMLSSKVNGEVKAVYATEGDKVSKGTVLAEIDHQEADLKLKTMYTKLDAAKISVGYWQDMEDKYAALLEKGAISQQQYNEVELKLQLAQAEAQTIAAGIAELESAVANYYIKAPKDGVITDILIEQGDMVMPGAPLIGFSGGENKKIVVSVVQEDLQFIAENTPVVVALGTDRVDTKVARILPTIDPKTNTAVVEIVCEDNSLSAGMAIEVSFITDSRKGVILIPSEAVMNKDGRPWVYVVYGDRAKLTGITVGAQDARHTEVVTGLEEGQRVACGNLHLLRDNGEVYIVGGVKF
ncbi:MAG: efflux RND transporter periplasmic adaptor subunit [Bacillota bacterium]|nr:efflux RND transporter periplasmic adaptor subunit [Bacillota bacterium]